MSERRGDLVWTPPWVASDMVRHFAPSGRVYGTGGSIGFPMGNAVGAMHIERDYRGTCAISFAPRAQEALGLTA